MMKTFKYIFLTALFTAALTSCSKKEETHTDENKKFVMSDTMFNTSTFADVKMEDAQNEIRLFGKVTAENNNMAQVFPAVGGSVMSIKAELGDYVKQGQLLASVQSSEVAGFQSQTSDADADVSIAERNLQSVKDLYDGKLASEKELVMAKKELDKARAEKERMTEVNKIYRLKSGSVYNMYAPISGYVVAKDISPNEMLSNNRDEAVFTIAKLDNVWVLANVNESDLARIKQGQEVSIQTIAYPDKKITGKIDKIFNVIDPQTRAAKALIKVPNNDGSLKPEMNATVTVHYSDNEKYIAVPSAAVVFDKNKNFVMVYKAKDDVETREVTIYRALDDKTYLKGGLKEGEKVIVKGNLLIYDAIND
ncbi:efflux RND transporter periplasmic adaptor subunit [Flavobacterium sp. DG1-102-2]|uniref:efflux RND transporter periplasmic adaptor subunit n=1 Tax=Flavobacterium sp. DG1-102-2 TaxID=3081663 RepID=UPI0029494DCE|nr:efflux RND transporter periplasmic adaptor subunit [Flavobacterium sp. DG1-102-2]MDV6167409.1 efflux RND transporter periplasmic adaptor subunit [Flavobacterium sp. DG1-102-2]